MTQALSYADREQRRRTLIAWSIAIAMYLCAFGAALLYETLFPKPQDISNNPLIVNIQGPIVNDTGRGAPIEKKDAVAEARPAPPPALAKTEKPAAKPAPSMVPTPAPASAAEPQAPALPSISTAQEPAEPWVPGPRAPGSRVSSSESTIMAPGEGQVPWGTGQAVTIRKAEKGNSVETTLGGSSETVGQNVYFPIYMAMPAPGALPQSFYSTIKDKVDPLGKVLVSAETRRRFFLEYYQLQGDRYLLRKPVPLNERDYLWDILEDAGYDVEQAEYKSGRTLNPVVIGFSITKDRRLTGVDLLQSSGDPDIDAAVLYGFKQSSFWNKSGETIQGRFVYRF